MGEKAYTLTGDPAVERGVQQMLGTITTEIVTRARPTAIVLYGSFAKGEGGAFRSRGGEVRVANDVDLMVVYGGVFSIVKALRARKPVARLADELAERLPVKQVDLITRPALVLRWPPRSLEYYETLRSARVLYGSVSISSPTRLPLDRVPSQEFSRLLFNRGGGLLIAWVWLTGRGEDLPEPVARTVEVEIDKAVLACGDVVLYRAGLYDHRLSVRVESLKNLARLGVTPWMNLTVEYERSARARLFPEHSVPVGAGSYRERFDKVVRQWLSCFVDFERFRLPHWDGDWRSYTGWRPVQRAPSFVRQWRDDFGCIPGPRRQIKALPILVSLLSQEEGPYQLRRRAAQLLRMREGESLSTLIARFLAAWHPAGAALRAAREAKAR